MLSPVLKRGPMQQPALLPSLQGIHIRTTPSLAVAGHRITPVAFVVQLQCLRIRVSFILSPGESSEAPFVWPTVLFSCPGLS